MTAALEGGEWSAARPGRTLPPGKSRYPFYRRLGVPQGRSGWAENLVSTGIRSRTVQPVVSRYTDRATGPTIYDIYIYIYLFIKWNWVSSPSQWSVILYTNRKQTTMYMGRNNTQNNTKTQDSQHRKQNKQTRQ